jgi:hypothetical protein
LNLFCLHSPFVGSEGIFVFSFHFGLKLMLTVHPFVIDKTIDQKCMWKNEYYLLLTVSAVWFQHPVLAELDPHRESQVSEKGPHSDCIKVFEDFSENPLDHGWSVFGDSQLFRWNQQLQLMEVTWDSSKPNSYLQFPLKTIMTRNDDFTIELDL